MKVTFLGTGTSQGVPIIACPCEVCQSESPKDKRLRTSILVETEGKTIVVDTGPDFRFQMLRAGVKSLDAVLFTHGHKDHTAGLDDIRPFNYLQQKKIPVYAEPIVQEVLRREFAYIFSDTRYPGIPEITLHTIGEQAFDVFGIPVIPIRALHYKLPVLGFRFGDFTYITDANYIDPSELSKIKGSKAVVLNALRMEPHISHYTLQEAIEVIQLIEPEQAYFTHISHQLGLHEAVSAALPAGINLAYDGLELVF